MKRRTIALIAGILGISMLTGCAPAQEPKETQTKPAAETSAESESDKSEAQSEDTKASETTLSPEAQKIKDASDNYITIVPFASLPTFNSTSPDVKDGVWDDKITNTKHGENISPELSWDAVDGATKYEIIMIDAAWLHMEVLTADNSLASGTFDKGGEKGSRYIGPYPPSGTHTYSIFIFALKDEPSKQPVKFNAGGNSLDTIFKDLDLDANGNTGNVLAYSRLDGNYTFKN